MHQQTYLEAKVVIQVVAVVDNCGVESLGVLHNNVMHSLRNHRRNAARCRIIIIEQIFHHVWSENKQQKNVN